MKNIFYLISLNSIFTSFPPRKKNIILFLLLVSLPTTTTFSWGFWAHKKINRMAVFTLPSPMIGFYKSHIGYITERAVAADKRRYANKYEGPKHYIDLDHYGKHALDSLPRNWEKAIEKYSVDTLRAYGIVPWHIIRMVHELTEAFKIKDASKILYLSADLGHYVSDAHVPLHCTENHNGQLTGQHGIHSFWESRLPELFGEKYDYFTGQAAYIGNTVDETWRIIRESSAAVDSVLLFEKELNSKFPSDKKYSIEKRGKKNTKVYSREYSEAYHKKLNGMVERRMRTAILRISSFWYTAWVDAGQPDLKELINKEIKDEESKKTDEEEKDLKAKEVKPKGHEEEE